MTLHRITVIRNDRRQESSIEDTAEGGCISSSAKSMDEEDSISVADVAVPQRAIVTKEVHLWPSEYEPQRGGRGVALLLQCDLHFEHRIVCIQVQREYAPSQHFDKDTHRT